MPEHQKVQKMSQSIQDKIRNMQKESYRCRRRFSEAPRGCQGRCRNGSRASGTAGRKRKKEEVVMYLKQVSAAWRKCCNRLRNEWSGGLVPKVRREMGALLEKMDEETVNMNKSKAEPVSSE